jgi:hypothetical protein
MQAGNAAREVGTWPGRGRLEALLLIAAVLAVAAVLALTVWVVPLTTSAVGAEDAVQKAGAGTAVVHDDAGNVNPGAIPAIVHDDAGNMPAGAGSAVIHDDAGTLRLR